MAKFWEETSEVGSPCAARGQAVESPKPPGIPPGFDQELVSRFSQVNLLVEVNRALLATPAGELKLEPILASLCERAPVRRVSIYRLEAEEGLLRLVATSGAGAGPAPETLALDGPGLVTRVAGNPEACHLPPLANLPGWADSPPGEFAVALELGSRILGVLKVESVLPEGLRAATRKLVEQFARQLTLVLERLELHRGWQAAKAEQARLQAEIVQMQKTQTLGRLARGIAHDFNNLLGVILGFASVLRVRLAPDDPAQEHIQMIEQSAERAADLTRRLLGVARGGVFTPAPVGVDEMLERLQTIVAETFDRRIHVGLLREAEGLWVRADATGLEQALLNLCLNARDAMPEGGTLRLGARRCVLAAQDLPPSAPCSPGPYVAMSVRDSGRGIGPDVLPRVFEPFFSTKGPEKGSGLGLPSVQAFVTQQGGFVRAESEPGRGSTFTLYLPALPPPPAHTKRESARALPRGSGTVLVVDDEPFVLAFAAEGLKRLGYRVVTAENAERALEIYAAHEREIDYLVVDMVLPGSSGLDLCRRLREINSHARILLSSGYSAARLAREARAAGAREFLAKPFTLEALAQALASLAQP